MPLFKYDNTSDYYCKVCDCFMQRRCVIKHFNTTKHSKNLMKKKMILEKEKKMKNYLCIINDDI